MNLIRRVAVILEQRFEQTPDGAVWTPGPFSYDFWTRYLDEFESVLVIARVRQVGAAVLGKRRASGPSVEFASVPHYVGLREFLRVRNRVYRAVAEAIRPDDAVIIRVPSVLGARIASEFIKRQRPYAVEVIGDPHDVFARTVFKHALRPAIQGWLTHNQQKQCRDASVAAYVTQDVLQRRYPTNGEMFSVSDVQIVTGGVGVRRGLKAGPGGRIDLVAVGTLAQTYKGMDTAIKAIRHLSDAGRDCRLTIVGDGQYREKFQNLAESLGVGSRVIFVGQLPAGEAVRKALDSADVFVMPSRTEGLPRALIEAMSRGLPCIAADVGGIPELLPASSLIQPNRPELLADAIVDLVADDARIAAESERNLKRAGDFTEENLATTRRSFLYGVKKATETCFSSLQVACPPAREMKAGSPQRRGHAPTCWNLHGLVNIEIDCDFPWLHVWEDVLGDVPSMCRAFGNTAAVTLKWERLTQFDTTGFREVEAGVFIRASQLIDRRYKIALDASQPDCLSFRTATPSLEWFIWSVQLALLQSNATFVHAAALARDGKVILFPSWGGVGKTVLCEYLTRHAGWKLLGDDLVILTSDGRCHAFPKSMVVYAYHKHVFPELFRAGLGPSAPLAFNEVLSTIGLWIKPWLRTFPEALQFAREHNPQSTRVRPSAAVGAQSLVTEGDADRLIWIERSMDATDCSVQSLVDTAGRVFGSTISQFDPRCIAVTHVAAGAGLIKARHLYSAWTDVLVAAFRDLRQDMLVVPAALGPKELGPRVAKELEIGTTARRIAC